MSTELQAAVVKVLRDLRDHSQYLPETDEECEALECANITLGCESVDHAAKGHWSWQTGDNSFIGAVYGYSNWAIGYLHKAMTDAEIDELAKGLINQWQEQEV